MTSPADQSQSNPAINETLPFLREAARELDGILHDDAMVTDVPLEVETQINSASKAVAKALRLLEAEVRKAQRMTNAPSGKRATPPLPKPTEAGSAKPTRQQGQFLASVREFMQHNYAEITPTHAELRKFFRDLTELAPPRRAVAGRRPRAGAERSGCDETNHSRGLAQT
ncbi:MAG: hypothetical protein NTY19_20605 [Planctomycetota bacterium]|nr:hypothetical protein [Planctomycetota bacterium]